VSDKSYTIRDATQEDLPHIQRIYANHVENGLASFEEVAPDISETRRRYDALIQAGYPYLVVATPGDVLGYAYAGPFRARPAYRFSVENSIYLDPAHAGKGIGRQLLTALIAACEPRGYRQMVAVIGDSANHGSIGVHRACGFQMIGLQPAVGFKFGRWVDSVMMQRAIGPGATTLPGPLAR